MKRTYACVVRNTEYAANFTRGVIMINYQPIPFAANFTAINGKSFKFLKSKIIFPLDVLGVTFSFIEISPLSVYLLPVAFFPGTNCAIFSTEALIRLLLEKSFATFTWNLGHPGRVSQSGRVIRVVPPVDPLAHARFGQFHFQLETRLIKKDDTSEPFAAEIE